MKKTISLILAISIMLSLGACTLPAMKNSNTASEVKTEKPVWLYPAYVTEGSKQKWGYIDATGTFVITPQFDNAQEFQSNSLAIVNTNELYGVIDKAGKYIVELKYKYIQNYSDGLAIAESNKGNYDVLDEKGQVVFTSTDYISSFENGFAVVTKSQDNSTYTYGYMDKSGNMAIQPVFKAANPFRGDKALVQLDEHKYALIDSKGNTIKELEYERIDPPADGVMAFWEKYGSAGYLDMDGNVIIKPQFSNAEGFLNGYAVVEVTNPAEPTDFRYGLIDKKGGFVVKPEYSSIQSIGSGFYTLCKESFTPSAGVFSKKAIANSKGEIITDFDYYEVGTYENGMVSVSDDNSTFFIDEKGQRVKTFSARPGIGTLFVRGDLITGYIDNDITYMTKEGKVVWQPDKTIKLAGGAKIIENKYRPDRCMLIQYPQLADMDNKTLQDKINKKLKKLFVGDKNPVSKTEDGLFTEDYTVGYTASQNKDLLIVEKDDYLYPVGAAHGMPGRTVYHINLKNGHFYGLKDLFKKDSKYVDKLSQIIKLKIEEDSKKEDSMYFVEQYSGISADQGFTITDQGLEIYFHPYEIAAYAAGFPSFIVSYGEIIDMIDAEGEFWNSFDKKTAGGQAAGESSDEKQKIGELINAYEQNMVYAINNNDFVKVELTLYPGSKLYDAQKGLVESLSRKGIKEKLDKYAVADIKKEPDGTYKIYVDENIILQYPGKDDFKGEYSWIYTAKFSEAADTILLTDIQKWNK